MKATFITCCAVIAAISVSPALAAGKKKAMKPAAKQETTVRAGPVAGAARATGAVVGGAAATAGTIATAPLNPPRTGPVSTINAPTCKPGTIVTINNQKMRCQ
jgi:hypothetical protein